MTWLVWTLLAAGLVGALAICMLVAISDAIDGEIAQREAEDDAFLGPESYRALRPLPPEQPVPRMGEWPAEVGGTVGMPPGAARSAQEARSGVGQA